MSANVRAYAQCATRLENRGNHPPGPAYVDDLIAGITAGRIEAIWHSAVDERGLPLFPSRVFPDAHEHGNINAFRHLISRVHEHGIPVLSWIPMNLGGGVLRTHPDWMMQFYELEGCQRDSSWDDRYVCINSPYRELLPQFVAEVVEELNFDGIWFDGSTFSNHNSWPWFLPGCKCDVCARMFRDEVGANLPTKIDYDDRTCKRWIAWRYDRLMSLWKACVEAVTRVRPDAVVCFNNYRRRHSANFAWTTAIPLRRLGWDCMMSGELDGFPHQADFQMKMHRAYACTRGVESWWPLCDHWRAWVPDHDPLSAIQASIGAIGAGGATCMGVGVNVKTFAPILHQIQDHAGPRIQFNDGEPVEYAAIWCSQADQDYAARHEPNESWDRWHGANELCRHSHLQSGVVFDDHVEQGELRQFRVLLASSRCVSERQARELTKFVEAGGVLLATHETGTYDEWGEKRTSLSTLDRLLGIVTRRLAEGSPTLELADLQLRQRVGHSHVSFGGTHVLAEPSNDVEVLAHVIDRTGGGGWDGHGGDNKPRPRLPGLWRRFVGRGAVFVIGVDWFGEYLRGPTTQMRRLFRELLVGQVTPAVTLDGPICVTVNTRQRADGSLVINLHNCPGGAYAYPAPPRSNCLHAFGEVNPVFDLVLRFDGIRIATARSGLTGQTLEVSAGGSVVRVPKLELHDALLLTIADARATKKISPET